MRFKSWVISEIQHISFPKAINVEGKRVDAIDFRFEDWPKGLNPQKSKGLLPKVSPSPFIFNNYFTAPLTNGTFLNVYTGPTQSFRDGAALKLAAQPVSISEEPEHQLLPSFWSRFAVFYLNGQIVKEPEWPRETDLASKLGKPKTYRAE